MRKVLSVVIALSMIFGTVGAVFAADEDVAGVGMTPAQAEAKGIVAFPGAEGGGMWTTGGRGGEVYHVTNLKDSGEGSLRDAISQPNRIVVFDVSGTINLESVLKFDQPNITIAGQTAPGDGICVAGYYTTIAADNIIVRYVRFRPGDVSGVENDAFWGRYQSNIMVDHCSTSWSTDETLSIYAVANATVQWCIISESLTLAAHSKGRHGYGGIWGGYNTTYHHNLVATHTSRTPRYGSLSSTHPDYKGVDGNDMVNNVIYNWGFNNAYGGEDVTLNVINNYYKPGAITLGNIKNQFFNPSRGAKVYMSGNVMEGNDEITKDNSLGFNPVPASDTAPAAVLVSEPNYKHLIPLENVDTAQEAYRKVLAGAGATLPKRDSYDAKIVNDTKNGTGRFVNNESEVGGWPALNTYNVKADTDGDGMPDEWENENGLDKNNAADGREYAENGYTNVENYLNSIVENGKEPHNPEVSIDVSKFGSTKSSLKNAIYAEGEPINVSVTAQAAVGGRSINKVQIFVNDTVVAEDFNASIRGLTDGQYYISARVVDTAGEATTSEVKEVNVNGVGNISPWKSMDIGEVEIPGAAWYKDGVYTVKSAGLIGPGNEWSESPENTDSFHYMYDKIDENGEISAEIVDVAKLTNNCVSGLMIRDSLSESADFALIDYEYKKMGAGLVFATRKDGKYSREEMILDTLPVYVKLQKEGGKIRGFHSTNGIDWIAFGEVELNLSGENYAGIAVDGCREDNQNPTYSYGKFRNLNLSNYGKNPYPTVEARISLLSQEFNFLLEASNDLLSYRKGHIYSIFADGSGFETVDYYIDGEFVWQSDAGAGIDDTAHRIGNHYITVIARSKDGVPAYSSRNIGVSCLPLEGWDITDIGDCPMTGAAEMDGDKITIYGAGFGIDDTTTVQTPYIYKQMSGDFKMKFKVPEQSSLHEYQQVGVMLRNGLYEGDQSYACYYQKYNGEYFKENNEKGKKFSLIGQQKYKSMPAWITVEKLGNTVKMEYSEDGVNFKTVGIKDTNLNDTYYLGFFGASHEELLVQPFTLEEISIEQKPVVFVEQNCEWAADAVNSLTLRGILMGDGYGSFNLNDEVTFAEFVTMAVRASGKEVPEAEEGEVWWLPYMYVFGSEFADVEVKTVQSTDGEYVVSLDDEVTISFEEFEIPIPRVDMAEIAASVFGLVPDYPADDAVSALSEAGILTGDEGGFRPDDTLTRAEAAMVIYRAMNK